VARISIPDAAREIAGLEPIRAFLAPHGITYERWDTGAPRVPPDAEPQDILAAYAPEIDALRKRGGYVAADVINVTPETPNLQVMLNKFNQEHTHADDEVRFILKGRGVFHIHPRGGQVFAIYVEAGDLLNVPAGTQHWFDVCPERTIRAIRLFKDPAGWTPAYVAGGVHAGYAPICLGPAYLPTEALRKH